MLTGGFQDIGIVKADNLDFTIIKELASRLARIINSTMGTYQHNYLHHAIANNSYRQHPPPKATGLQAGKMGSHR
jgi:hypothetical protein